MRHSLLKTLTAISLVAGFMLSTAPITEAKTAVKAPVKKVAAKKVTAKKKWYYTVSAVKGKDEKNFSDPTTRCLTANMKSRHATAVKQMEADVLKAGPRHGLAEKAYRENMDIIWSAMYEPYCGYGSLGVTAVAKSFDKSVVKTRAKFMAAIKTLEPEPPIPSQQVEPLAPLTTSTIQF